MKMDTFRIWLSHVFKLVVHTNKVNRKLKVADCVLYADRTL